MMNSVEWDVIVRERHKAFMREARTVRFLERVKRAALAGQKIAQAGETEESVTAVSTLEDEQARRSSGSVGVGE